MRASEELDQLCEEIRRLPEVDVRATRSKRRFIAELNRLDRPFDEHADPVHVTASAVVCGPRGTLLHRHKRLGLWLQPGGHIDDGEAPCDAAVREVAEEAGIVTTHPDGAPLLLHVDVHSGAKGHTHLDLRYLLVAGDDDCAPSAGESPHCRWFVWPEAMAIADPGLIGALRLAQLTRR
ncbi:MAG: NUDIX hydrolase [Egibacteraceae bacterium]